MAATAAYVDIVRIGGVNEGVRIANSVGAATAFALQGGKYGVTVKASTYGTVTLKILCADGSTLVPAMTAFSADGYASVDLPPGSYQVILA